MKHTLHGMAGLARACVIVSLLAAGSNPACAENNTTNFLANDGLLQTIIGNAVVGNSGTNNYGEVSNGSILTNIGGYGVVSLNSPAAHNLAVVSGAGSLWTIDTNYPMVVGFYSGEADLLITNSGRVQSPGGGIIGYYYNTVSNNTVTVTGTGSAWDIGAHINSYLWVGGNGYNNTLEILNGATITNLGSTAMGVATTSSNNLILVSGAGSKFVTLGSDFSLGGGGGNTLVVANGGYHESINFRGFAGSTPNQILITNGGFVQTIGLSFGESAFNGGNLIRVSGAGSVYTNTGSMLIGQSSSNNTVVVENGGKMYNKDNMFIGGYFGSAGAFNNVLVTGAGSLFDMNTAGGSAVTYLGYAGDGNTLTISDGGQANASTLYMSTTSNRITVSDSGSALNIASILYANFGGYDNQIIVTNGGKLITPATTMGYYGNGGLIEVTGSGSVYSNTGTFGISVFGGTNTVAVRNGGLLYVGDSMNIGNNTGEADRLITTGGGQVKVLTNLTIGNSVGNSGLVSDPGSVWDIGVTLMVGNIYANNSLVITNGAVVKSGQGIIGQYGSLYGYTVTNNSVLVTGLGSVWSNTTYGLYVGNIGNNNHLRIENGGKVYNTAASPTVMGGATSASNNTILVTGAGSLLSTPNHEMIIGSVGANNSVTVADGAQMKVGISLFVGSLSAHNTLVVTNGGQVFSGQGVIGYYHSSPYYADYNSVVVTGSGSVWSNSHINNYPIYVGLNGSSNRLVISEGGKVYTPTTYVSYGAESTNNIVNISGDGSLLQNGSIYVGNVTGPTSGQDAHVNVTDGGTLDTTLMMTGIGGSGTISNRGGIYQFSTATPTVTPHTAGTIAISNGTISYRGVASADINNAQVGNMSKSGNNGFRLNNSSNAVVASYTFDSVANTGNPTNYQRLTLQNNSRWRSGNLTIGTGGGLTAGEGDVVEVSGNLTILDANNLDQSFDLSSATVTFTGGGAHTNAVTGKDLGNDGLVGYPDGFTAFNYSYDTLMLGGSDQVYFISGDNASSNALYVLNLDLGGNTNLVANLHAPSNINIYYGISSLAPGNAYLNDLVYNLDGGGLLLPAIPEPSAALLLVLGLGFAVRRKRTT